MRLSSTLMMTMAGILFTAASFAQSAGDYRSVNAPKPGGGNWSDITKWEEFDGVSWLPAATAPNSGDGVITIQTGDSIVVNVAVTADQLVVAAGAFLNVNAPGNNLTLNNGAGTDLTVNGTLLLRGVNTIAGPGTIEVNGVFNWFSGALSAPTTTTVGSTTNLALDFVKTLNTSFTNAGTFNWESGATTGGITFNNGTFINDGTINELFQSNRGFANGAGTNAFINNGTFNKLTTFTFFNTGVSFTNNGTMGGTGTISLNAPTSNPGTIRPGNSPGVLATTPLAISGQATTIAIEIVDNSGVGVGHDQLTVSGSADLSNATLSVVETGTGAPFEPYTVLTTSGTFTGTFAAENVPSGYTVTYNASSVVVTKIAFPLPADWGDFSALAKNGNVHLSWTTLQENNTSYFEVEYSTNGRDFKSIATVPAAGYSSLVKKYSATHNAASAQAANYYRIKLYDLDGKTSLSSVRSVKFTKGAVVVVQATPNPVISNLQISVQESAVDITLVDMSGRVFKSLRNLQPGVHAVNVSELASGQYQLLIYQNNRMIQSQKIIKQ